MGFLQADKKYVANGVTVNEYLLTKHNPNNIDMPWAELTDVIGVTIHNTDWITTATGTHPSEQYTRATVNGNMGDVRVHFYVDDVDAWQNLPLSLSGWHAADGDGPGNRKTIAIECIMSSRYTSTDQKSEDNAARLCAYLLDKYKLGIDHLYTHQHWYPAKYCPAYILPHYSKFVSLVKKYMKGSTPAPAPAPTPDTSEMYRVRRTWGDAASQKGAYRNFESAKTCCNQYPDYHVFNSLGESVYHNAIKVTEFGVQIRTLRKGMSGPDVKSLQQLLFAKGYSVGRCGDDGDFGEETEDAVLRFQSASGLDKDGVVGIDTFSKLWGIN